MATSVQGRGGGQPLLEARGVDKFFPGVKALQKVDFELRAGQIHALVGENGAGKSTLMKIMSGLYQPDGGELYFRGQKLDLPTPLSAQKAGISTIHQEFFLAGHLTVAQNIFIGREPRKYGGLIIDDAALNRKASRLLDRLGVDIDPREPAERLTVAAQQMVEIAKAFSFDSSVLIMDEPTAALTDAEVETLFGIMDAFVSEKTGIIYISHRLEEIGRKATDVTVLRDGMLVDSRPVEQMPTREIIRLMVGREIVSGARPAPRAPTEPLLRVSGLSTADLLRDVSFELEQGEILGFAGLMGAGRTETARALIGADPKTAGSVSIRGVDVSIRAPSDAANLGIGYLSEDRKRYGLILNQDVAANTGLASIPKYTRWGLLQDGPMRKAAQKWVDVLKTRTPSVRQALRNLSGGNQQKVVLAKWLECDSDILIFDEPTRGIDVGAKQEIYDLLDQLTAQGKSIIMISSEMDEVLRLADRIVVMSGGKVTGTLTNEEATAERIMELATATSRTQEVQ